jgi:hypothetical protein
MPLRRAQLSLLLTAFLAVIGGCSTPGFREICSEALPGLEARISEAITQLKTPEAGRRIASVERRSWTDSEREDWEAWSERGLKETQRYLDHSHVDPLLAGSRRKLSAMAKHWVELHGYSARGELRKMLAILLKLKDDARGVQALSCARRG